MDTAITHSFFLKGNYAPTDREETLDSITVKGELPRDLIGTYYRTGPNPKFEPRGEYHWFDGDGMIHGWRFDGEGVSYRNRWVHTKKLALEEEHGRALFGGFADPTATDPIAADFGPEMKSLANTQVLWHGGKLLALYEANLPYAVDGDTLATLGEWDFEGAISGRATAHPKVDPKTGEMLFFGYSYDPRAQGFEYRVADPAGTITKKVSFDLPFRSLMHDFATTDKWVIVMDFPATMDVTRIPKGESVLKWEPDLGSHIALMPRDGGADDVTWLTTDPCYVFHVMNAFDLPDGKVALDMCVLPSFGMSLPAPEANLERWVLDPVGGSIKRTRLDDVIAEFPRIDDRLNGLPYRYGYAVGEQYDKDPMMPYEPNAIYRYEPETGKRTDYVLPEGDRLGEAQFAPRTGGDGPDDGYILTVVWRATEKRSDLIILSSKDFEAGPIAEVQMPFRVPFGFHGNWRQGL